MKIKTPWFMIEIKKYTRCSYIYSDETIEKETKDLKKMGLDRFIRKGKKCLVYKNYDKVKGCPFHEK
jgi:hypothetical protein